MTPLPPKPDGDAPYVLAFLWFLLNAGVGIYAMARAAKVDDYWGFAAGASALVSALLIYRWVAVLRDLDGATDEEDE